jgi:hypothetical protein
VGSATKSFAWCTFDGRGLGRKQGFFASYSLQQPAVQAPWVMAVHCGWHRPGMQCPMPNVTVRCPAGTFCGRGAVTPTTCSYVDLLQDDPWTIVPTLQRTVREHVYLMGDPMAGNFCPAVRSLFSPLPCFPRGCPPAMPCLPPHIFTSWVVQCTDSGFPQPPLTYPLAGRVANVYIPHGVSRRQLSPWVTNPPPPRNP